MFSTKKKNNVDSEQFIKFVKRYYNILTLHKFRMCDCMFFRRDFNVKQEFFILNVRDVHVR